MKMTMISQSLMEKTDQKDAFLNVGALLPFFFFCNYGEFLSWPRVLIWGKRTGKI